MCSRNGSAKLVGKVALINNLQEPMSFGAFMMIIRSNYYPYLQTYFQMDAFRRQIKTGATTTINQITGNMMGKIRACGRSKDAIRAFRESSRADPTKAAERRQRPARCRHPRR